MLSALLYLKCNEHVAVYNTMTLKLSNVKRRFGYALNFFYRELKIFDVFRFDSIIRPPGTMSSGPASVLPVMFFRPPGTTVPDGLMFYP